MPRISRAKLRSATYHALKAHAAKEADRDLLEDGQAYDLEIEITSRCSGAAIQEELAGVLTVGHETQVAGSTGANVAHLVAHLLDQLPKAKRLQMLDALPEKFEKSGKLPDVDPTDLKAVERMLKRMRHRTTQTKRGAVSYRPAVAEAA